MADFSLRELEGFRYALTPHTAAAQAWIKNHVSKEQTWVGNSLFVEHGRYAQEIVEGIRQDGLSVETHIKI